jgi:hypothetical protein
LLASCHKEDFLPDESKGKVKTRWTGGFGLVHIVNGEAVAEKLKVDGDVIVWREMYDIGPLDFSWSSDEMISRRAAFF